MAIKIWWCLVFLWNLHFSEKMEKHVSCKMSDSSFRKYEQRQMFAPDQVSVIDEWEAQLCWWAAFTGSLVFCIYLLLKWDTRGFFCSFVSFYLILRSRTSAENYILVQLSALSRAWFSICPPLWVSLYVCEFPSNDLMKDLQRMCIVLLCNWRNFSLSSLVRRTSRNVIAASIFSCLLVQQLLLALSHPEAAEGSAPAWGLAGSCTLPVTSVVSICRWSCGAVGF